MLSRKKERKKVGMKGGREGGRKQGGKKEGGRKLCEMKVLISLSVVVIPPCVSNHHSIHLKYMQLYLSTSLNKVGGKINKTLKIRRCGNPCQ